MTTDGSMAAWGRHRVGAEGAATVEVHFNYWRIAGAKIEKTKEAKKFAEIAGKDFVEVGVFLRGAPNVESFSVYLPGSGSDWRLEDCGHRFGIEISQGIFNLQLSSHAHGPPGPKRIDLVEVGNGNFCRVHLFPTDGNEIDPTQLVQAASADGLVLTITRKAITEACYELPADRAVYFRLRAYYVGPKKKNPFVKTIKPSDRYLKTGYNVVEYLDFRLNEARTLPARVEAMMREGNEPLVPTVLVAFLTAVPVQSDVTTISWDRTHKKRVLEDDLWAAYVPAGIPQGMTVIHWKDEGKDGKPIRDFSAFVKVQTRLVSWSLLLTSIMLAFVFGVAGNLVASWIWDSGWAEQRTRTEMSVTERSTSPVTEMPTNSMQTPSVPAGLPARRNANSTRGQND